MNESVDNVALRSSIHSNYLSKNCASNLSEAGCVTQRDDNLMIMIHPFEGAKSRLNMVVKAKAKSK